MPPQQPAVGANDLFIAHKDLVEKVTRRICARHHIYGDEREEHRGESSLATFLTTVVANFARDFREKKWGKWRNSTVAADLGPVALHLEALLTRERLTMEEACETLRTRGVVATRADLEAMAGAFPVRRRPREVQPDEETPEPVAPSRTDEPLLQQADRTAAGRVRRILGHVLDALSPRDRLIIKLRFYDNLTQVAIARMLGIEAKLFFRQGDRLVKELRTALEARGLTRDEMLELLEHRGLALLEDLDE